MNQNLNLFLCKKENYGYSVERPEIEYYIPKIQNGNISILIKNSEFGGDIIYSIILVEDNSDNDYLLNQLDNECYLFSLINNEIKDIKYEIINFSLNNEKFLYEEIDYSKFSNSKNLLIRIYSCENEKDVCIFSKANKIYFEKIKQNDVEEDFGIKKIEELTQYNITRQEYIFSYDYESYLHNVEDIFIYITIPQTSNDYVGELGVINPLMQNFTYKYKSTQAIPLIRGREVVSKGKYYFIFRNGTGVTFYLYNTISFFPLNKINIFRYNNFLKVNN